MKKPRREHHGAPLRQESLNTAEELKSLGLLVQLSFCHFSYAPDYPISPTVIMTGDHSTTNVGAKTQQSPEQRPACAATAAQTTANRVSPAVITSSNFDISCKKKGDGKTTVMSHVLSHDPNSLRQYIKAQGRKMPNPILRIRGTHKGRLHQGINPNVVNLDFTISMSHLYPVTWRRTKVVPNGWSTYRGTRTKSDSPPGMDVEASIPIPSIEDWCREFCAARWVPKE